MRAPHYIWLFLILISSIPHYFVISNHIILLISKKNSKQILFNKKKFQINFKSETKYSPKLPRTPTRNPGNRILFPRSPSNDKLPFPDSPNPRGMEIAGELASLTAEKDFSLQFFEITHGSKSYVGQRAQIPTGSSLKNNQVHLDLFA